MVEAFRFWNTLCAEFSGRFIFSAVQTLSEKVCTLCHSQPFTNRSRRSVERNYSNAKCPELGVEDLVIPLGVAGSVAGKQVR